MRVLVVDDEPAARRRLHLMLDELDVEVAGDAADGVQALEKVAELAPDVLLLDIAMPEVDGFDVVWRLPEPRPLVIFQTAYDEHAMRAFEHEALDYVVKPVTLERLRASLDRARRRLGERRPAALPVELLDRLQVALGGAVRARPARLLVRDGTGHRLVPLAEIVRLAVDDRLVFAIGDFGRRATDYTLAELEARTGSAFVRVNRAELVNVDRIARIQSDGDGSATLTLSDGQRVHVSRRRAAEVRAVIER